MRLGRVNRGVDCDWVDRLLRRNGGGGVEGWVDRRCCNSVRRGRRGAGDVVQRLAERAPVPRTSEQDRAGTSLFHDAELAAYTSSRR